jgi:hypothetical protein
MAKDRKTTRPRKVLDGRTITFTMRLSEQERGWLTKIAARSGLDSSDYLRLFIRNRHAEMFPKKRGTTPGAEQDQ